MVPWHHAWGDQVIYDTSIAYNTNFFLVNNGQELGNQLSIAPNRYSLTSFALEYYAPDPLAGNVAARLRLYLNDGPVVAGRLAPGTLFYDSGWDYGLTSGPVGNDFGLAISDLYSGAALPLAIGSTLPANFTFTITFTNVTAGAPIYLPLANGINNQTANSVGDYWLDNNGQWNLLTNSSPANLVVQATGVPEPTTGWLGALGLGLVWLASQRRVCADPFARLS